MYWLAAGTGSASDFTSHRGIMLGLVALVIVIVVKYVFFRRS